ncbi:hypothetical protein GOBAR_DD19822 [Gossypium barbadense]|nr:hypothetical protein GOBAR_DD19822 [Gossypium barbadense]
MESEFASLSLEDEDEEILQAQGDTESVSEEEVLSHNESFCEAKMEAGVEIDEMSWDLSLRAQSIRAQAMSSAWLREEGGFVDRNN